MPSQRQHELFYIVELLIMKVPISVNRGILLYGAAWLDEGSYIEKIESLYPEEESRTIAVPIVGPKAERPHLNEQAKIEHLICRVDGIRFHRFETLLAEGCLDLSQLGVASIDLPKEAVIIRPETIQIDKDSEWSRRVISPAPEGRCRQRVSKVSTFWPATSDRKKISNRIVELFSQFSTTAEGAKAIAQLTEVMQSMTGLTFTGAYSQRIGTFERYRFASDLADEQFAVRGAMTMIGRTETITGVVIERPSALREGAHMAHVVLRNVSDIILSRIVLIPAGAPCSHPIHSSERVSESNVTVYSADGSDVIFHEHRHFLRGAGFEMMLIHGRARIADPFSSGKLASKTKLQESLESVVYGMRSHDVVADYSADPWYSSAFELGRLVSQVHSLGRQERFFARGEEGQVDVILYVKSLIEEFDNEAVIIADPFFDSHALGRILPRITNSNASIQVITSLVAKRTDDETAESLRQTIQKNSKLLPRSLRVVSLARGKDQAFHDRYIYLKKKNGAAVAHVLTNSLNKASGDWPLCITSLNASTSLDVGLYLENLVRGVDVHSPKAEISLEIIWPQLADSKKAQAKRASTPDSIGRIAPTLRWLFREAESVPEEVLLALARERNVMYGSQGEPDRISFDKRAVLIQFIKSWKETPISEPRKLAHVFLGLGEIAAKSASPRDTFEYISVLRCASEFTSQIADFLAIVSELTWPGDSDVASQGASAVDIASLAVLKSSQVDRESIESVRSLISNRSLGVTDWGLRWVTQIVSVISPRECSGWIATANWSAPQARAILAGWEAIFESDCDGVIVDDIVADANGPLRVCALTFALGGGRIRPVLSLERCAKVLLRIGADPAFRAAVLLASYKDRSLYDNSVFDIFESLSIERLAEIWPSESLSRGQYLDIIKMDREKGRPLIFDLAASLAATDSPLAARQGLDLAIVAYAQRSWASKRAGCLLSGDVDLMDSVVVSWCRVSPENKRWHLLPNVGVIEGLAAKSCRDFPVRGDYDAWLKDLVALTCYAYVGVKLYWAWGDVPRAEDFAKALFMGAVLPLVSVFGAVRGHVFDGRVLEVLVHYSLVSMSKYFSDRKSLENLSQIAGDRRFDGRIRAHALHMLKVVAL